MGAGFLISAFFGDGKLNVGETFLVLAIGMAIIFGVLILIWGFLALSNLIFKKIDGKKEQKSDEIAEIIGENEENQEEIEEEVVAAITAAITLMGEENKIKAPFVIRRIRKK